MNNKWISDIIIGLVETYETNDVYSLCDFLNIEIIELNNNHREKSYFLCNKYGDSFIFIKSSIESKERRALIAHELGHAVLHTNVGIEYYSSNKLLNRGKFEKQADYFAAQLLLSSIQINDYMWDDQTIDQLADELEIFKPCLEGIL